MFPVPSPNAAASTPQFVSTLPLCPALYRATAPINAVSVPSAPTSTSGDGPISSLPTFIRTAYDQYVSRRQIPDYYARYKALESVYATTIKYVGTSFALIAADHDPDLKVAAWSAILQSSSLGGWTNASDLVCRQAHDLPKNIRDYCDNYNAHKKHPSKPTLDAIAVHLNVVVDELITHGYNVERPKSLSILRALEYAVVVRNCCAHGALDLHFFDRIETDFIKALKLLLLLIPFSEFVFWGQFGGNAVRFSDWPPPQLPRTRQDYFWVESSLLKDGFATSIPFLLYRQDSRTVYFLNDAVTADAPTAQYIDYGSGHVVYPLVSQETRDSHP